MWKRSQYLETVWWLPRIKSQDIDCPANWKPVQRRSALKPITFFLSGCLKQKLDTGLLTKTFGHHPWPKILPAQSAFIIIYHQDWPSAFACRTNYERIKPTWVVLDDILNKVHISTYQGWSKFHSWFLIWSKERLLLQTDNETLDIFIFIRFEPLDIDQLKIHLKLENLSVVLTQTRYIQRRYVDDILKETPSHCLVEEM